MVMDSPVSSPPHVDVSRPSICFPLGTALLIIIIFTLSGVFSCCYHWDKLRSLRRSFSDHHDADHDIEASPSKPKLYHTDMKKNEVQSFPVIMPGDELPKFIALPCPCEPPREEKMMVKIQLPPRMPMS